MITKPKGTYDIYGELGRKYKYVDNAIDMLMKNYKQVHH